MLRLGKQKTINCLRKCLILFYNNLVTITILKILNYSFGIFRCLVRGKSIYTVEKSLHYRKVSTLDKSLYTRKMSTHWIKVYALDKYLYTRKKSTHWIKLSTIELIRFSMDKIL